MLNNIVLHDTVSDKWIWKHDPNYGYLVKGVYQSLTRGKQHKREPFTKIIWNKAVTLKVSLFSWKLLNKRIPTKDNLVHHVVINLDSLLCLGGCEKEETINQLFMECAFSGSILIDFMHWLRVRSVMSNDVSLHVFQFVGSHLFHKIYAPSDSPSAY